MLDANDQAAAARFDRARGLMARTGAAMAFAEPEMIGVARWSASMPMPTPDIMSVSASTTT